MFEDIIPQGNYIDGLWHTSDATVAVTDKFLGSELTKVYLADSSQVELAAESSLRAFHEYSEWSSEQRSELLGKLIEGLSLQADDFAKLIAMEAGKPLFYAKAEVDRCLTTLEFSQEEARRVSGEVVPMDFGAGVGKTALTKRFPVGPIVGISPFNFPLNLALHKIGPALAAGCSITIKPSPFAPLSLLAFAKIFENAGAPRGLLNVLLTEIPEAEKLVKDSRFKLFSFTGSPQVGWALKQKVGQKKVLLELGGNAAVIVDSSCDLDNAAKTIANGAFLYAGQICISTQRILVDESISEKFTKVLVKEIKEIKAGNPLEPGISVGPLISSEHLDRIDSWVTEAVADEAAVLVGGEVLDREHNIYAPTLLTNIKHEMKVCCQEVFGPVAVLETYSDFERALDTVNNSEFGLQAGLFTDSMEKIKKAFEGLEVGGLMINNVPGFRIDNMPYGGVKNSGLGREGITYSIEEMTEPRLLVF